MTAFLWYTQLELAQMTIWTFISGSYLTAVPRYPTKGRVPRVFNRRKNRFSASLLFASR